MSLLSPIPTICVSPAPEPEVIPEPYSPFSPKSFTFAQEQESNRPTHLTPPATSLSFKRNLSLSPLRPPDSPITGKGLERQRFEALLKASRERNAAFGQKRSLDLRKDVAMKAHNKKTLERRAFFLSKVLAPPSPSATELPKTPPESPAIFHYTLPSPGLVSPLALFETFTSENPADPTIRETWVEQVDFRLPVDKDAPNGTISVVNPPRPTRHRKLPSLEQITARISIEKGEPQAEPLPAAQEAATAPAPSRGSQRLPAFLRKEAQAPVVPVVASEEKPVAIAAAEPLKSDRLPKFLQERRAAVTEEKKPAEKVTLAPIVIPTAQEAEAPAFRRVGRLQMPVRRTSPTTPTIAVTPASPEVSDEKSLLYALTPRSPRSPLSPKLQVTTTIVPRIASVSPVELSTSNLDCFNQCRESTSRNMMLRLSKRRGLSISLPKKDIENIEPGSPVSPGGTKKSRRLSSPAELPLRKASGFKSSVLNIPGAF